MVFVYQVFNASLTNLHTRRHSDLNINRLIFFYGADLKKWFKRFFGPKKMHFLSFSFFAILYFVVTNIKCAEKSTILEERINLYSGFNFTHSLDANYSAEKVIELDLSEELLGEEIGKRCLKNVTRCMEEGEQLRFFL